MDNQENKKKGEKGRVISHSDGKFIHVGYCHYCELGCFSRHWIPYPVLSCAFGRNSHFHSGSFASLEKA